MGNRPTVVARDGEGRIEAAAYHPKGDAAKLAGPDAVSSGKRVGSGPIDAVETGVRGAAGRRLWLVATNANLDAVRFYQRRGFRLARLHAGELDHARRLKPAIPEIGAYGIPTRDELELEKMP